MNKQNKKSTLVIASIIGVVLIAAAVVTTLVVVRGGQNQVAELTEEELIQPENQRQQLVPDTSKDFGACSVIDMDQVKETLGVTAAEMSGPVNLGIVNLAEGGQAQICSYPFGENSKGNNEFVVEITAFTDEAVKDLYANADDPRYVEVEGIAERAYYFHHDPIEGAYADNYNLYVFKGMNMYRFTISLPVGTAAFTPDTAREALTTIASNVTFP